jgi:hypothetical protein
MTFDKLFFEPSLILCIFPPCRKAQLSLFFPSQSISDVLLRLCSIGLYLINDGGYSSYCRSLTGLVLLSTQFIMQGFLPYKLNVQRASIKRNCKQQFKSLSAVSAHLNYSTVGTSDFYKISSQKVSIVPSRRWKHFSSSMENKFDLSKKCTQTML